MQIVIPVEMLQKQIFYVKPSTI